jgi:hypothetical protein
MNLEWLKEHRDELYAAAFHIYCQNLKIPAYNASEEHGFDPVKIYDDDYKPINDRISHNVHWWFSEDDEPELYAMLGQLSARTLVKLSWQEELDFVICLHVGEKIYNRALKEELQPFTKVTEDQIGRYLGKSGLHKKINKVNYNHIDKNAGLTGGLPVNTVRLSGWLIGGDVPDTSKPTPFQKKVAALDAKAETVIKAPLVLTAKDVEEVRAMGTPVAPEMAFTQDDDKIEWTL